MNRHILKKAVVMATPEVMNYGCG